MQNFTLGKKGLSMLFFAFILLIGSSPSFGQACPTVNASDQAFCDSQEPQVGDLNATAGTEPVAWYTSQTSLDALPATQFLVSGRTYFAGTTNESCVSNRVPVNVTIYSEPEILGINATARQQAPATKQSLAVIGICVVDEENPDVAVGDLRTNFDNVEGVVVNFYYTRTGGEPIPPSTKLIDNTDYFASITVTDPNIEGGSCTTNRRRTTVRLFEEEAPTGPASQTFCASENPTLADVEASGTNRYFTSATSVTELGSDTPLEDGRTYYISSLGEFCESIERLAVTVTVQEPVDLGTPEPGIICESDVQETFPSVDAIRNFYLALLPEGTPTNGTFNPTPETIAQDYQARANKIGDYTTVYTVGVDGCESSVELTVSIVAEEEANAGTIGDITLECGNLEPIDLASLPNDEGNPGGVFSGEGVSNGIFDPSVGPGTYSITYSVDDSAECVIEGTSDSTTFTITVPGSELGEPIVLELCIIEAQALLASPTQAEEFFNNILEENGITNFDGTFDPSENVVGSEIFAYINSNPTAPETFETTYSVTNDCGEDSVLISLTINNTTTPNAGEFNPAPVCSSATPFDLFTLLGEDNDQGGTFSNEAGVIEGGMFDVSENGTYTITYTVTENAENCTAGEPDSTEFTLTVNEGTVAENPDAAIVCETDVQTLFPSNDEVRKFYVAIARRAGFPTNGTFDPNVAAIIETYQNDEDGLGDFTTTYTFGEGDCQTSVQLTVTIVAAEEANAGSIEDVTVNCDSNEMINLASLPNEGGNTGGTFTGEGVNEAGNFDPSVGPGTYAITYSVDDSADCVIAGTTDQTTFNITVQGSLDLGAPIVMEMCITEVQALLTNPQAAVDLFDQALQDSGIEDLDGEFSPALDIVAGQIAAYLSNPTPSQTFETTYSVSSDCGEDSVLISLTINNTTTPNAGEFNPAPVCSSATPFDLFTLLGEDNDQGGTFSNEAGVIEGGMFDVSENGTYTIIYSVTENAENCTAGEPDSTEFTLTVNEGTVAENPDAAIVCETDVQTLFPSNDEVRKFYVAIARRAGFPTNGTFDPNVAAIIEAYQNDEDGLGDFTTTYTFGEGDCQTSVQLTVTIVAAEEANAGSIEDVTVNCDSNEMINLASLPNEGGNTGGTFTGEGVNEAGNFDPSVGPGTYTITYSVDDTADCVIEGSTDSTTFDITVQSSLDLGAPIVMEMCITEVQALLTNPGAATNIFNQALEDRQITDLTGTFTPAISTVAGQIAAYLSNPTPSQTFETTYSVTNDCGEDSVLISLTINNTVAPNAGEINPATVCSSATPFDLFTLLGEDNDQGGIFSNEAGEIEGGMFDVSENGTYTITYTVTENAGNCTAGEPDSTEFTLTVNEGTVAENPADAIVCEADVQTLFPSVDEIRKYYIAIARRAGFPTNGTLNPTAAQIATNYQNDDDGLGRFTTTYTFGEGDCRTSVELTANIVAEEEATVDPIEDSSVCVSEEGLDLTTFVSNNTMGGTFTSDNGTITGNTLNVSEAGTFNITYTVSESDPTTCLTGTASETFIITAGGSVNAGADATLEVCNSDVRNLRETGVRNLYLGLLDEGVPTNGTFNPSINDLIAQYNIVSNYGDFVTEYTVGSGNCSDTVILTVTVLEANDAGEDVVLDLCSTEDAVNLFDFLSPFATTTGTFVGYEDGMFDPATADAETVITYEVEEDDSECSTGNFTSTFTINVSEPEDANAGEDVTAEFCVEQDENIQLSTLLTAGANLRGSFEAPFENGIFNPSVAGEGTYEIDYTVDEDDCAIGTAKVTLTINVTSTGETPVADAEQSFCLIDEPTVADIVVEGDNIVIYQNADLTTEADATSPLVDGAVYYAVSTSGGNACGSDAVMITVTLTDADAPTLVVEGNEFCRSDSPTVQELINNLTGNGIQIYSSLTGGTALATTTALVDGTTYFASGTNSTTQCESSERRAIQVEVGFCGIPEGFSPNDDGINDEFVIPEIAEDFPNYTIQVYNRWGSLVFEGNASTGDWDGLSNQSATLGDGVLPAGVYFYILDYNDGQTQPVQGKVYLSR